MSHPNPPEADQSPCPINASIRSFSQRAVLLLGLALGLAAISPAKAATWVTNSPLITARYGHAATALASGQVLVVGGSTSTGVTTGAELFDPDSGAWTSTGAMQDARLAPTVALLTNGLVLVTGGQGQIGGLSSTELYNVDTGLWETNGVLSEGRQGHTATLLKDGRVLVVGGYAGSNPAALELASAEIYDPVTQTWTSTGSLTASRQQHTATLLPTGQVLIVGGVQSNNIVASAELYDPNLGTWSPTDKMTFARRLHTATLLPNKQVLVAGGTTGTDDILVAELYDPATGLWTTTGTLQLPRNSHSATLLPDGEVLVSGGSSVFGGQAAIAETYDPTSELWQLAGQMNTPRAYHSATLLANGVVLVAGGIGNHGRTASTERYVVPAPFALSDLAISPGGGFQFGFTNFPGLSFEALAATDLSLPLSSWAVLGGVTEISPGQFQFTDPQATNSPQRFYQVRSN